MKWICINNDFVEEGKAILQAGDMAVQRGYGVFDFFRIYNNKPLFIDDYLNRFFNSAKEMFIIIPFGREELKENIYRLIAMNNMPESGIRITATGGYAADSYSVGEGNIIIQQQPLLLPPKEKFVNGIKIITYPYMRDLPQVKSINYLMGVWLQKQLKEKQLDDVLYFQNNTVTEFPRSNVFIVTQDGELATPAHNVLAGITRKKILQFSPDIISTSTRDVSTDELKNAAEVFMTSTTKRILPVTEINGEKVGDGKPGSITTRLYERFLELEESYLLHEGSAL
ncbi:MAG TPA: aminotransferase class IV [Parafilimonas sp.]|nr:aminotransferase class IV [Parafilimonas sp.]